MQKHLHIQIFIVLFIAATIIAIISSIFTFQTTHKRVFKTYHYISVDLLATVAETASLACYLGQEDMMNDVVKGLVKNRIIAGASLVNSEGVMVQEGVQLHKIIQGNKYIIKYPLMPLFKADSTLNSEKIGEIVLIQNKLLIEQRAKEAARRDGLSIIQLTFLTIFLASVLVYIFFTKSIRSIAKVLHNTKAGSLDMLKCPARHRKNEIGSLISDINSLLKKNADALNAERSLRKRLSFLENRYRMMFEQANSAIFLADKNGKVIINNPFFEKLAHDTGKKQLILRNFTRLFIDLEKAEHLIKITLAKKRASSGDMLIATNKSPQIWMHAVFINCEDENGQQMIEGMLYDITQRYIEEEQTRQIATKDHLTGLLNRRGGEIRIDQIFSSCKAEHYIAFFLMDLDGFKQINDTYGHDAGDKILTQVATRLQSVNRSTDTIVRWGGDEFVLVLYGDIDKNTCFGIGEKILYELRTPIDLGNNQFDAVGASIGISLMSAKNADKKDLIQSADKAMYEIKNKGKNGICYCENNSTIYETKFF